MMNIFDFFRNKKHKIIKQGNYNISETELIKLLQEEIETFFPEEGFWTHCCFERSNEVSKRYLPCHLRDNEWLAKLIKSKLIDKGICAPEYQIRSFIDNSERFAELRHNYELAIVRWQIDYMNSGGSGWLMPEGYDEISLLIGTSVDKMIRRGIVKTLSAIGMDKEVIEEGIEKNANIWRDKYMQLSFDHKFDPHIYGKGYAEERPSEELRENWMKLRTYEYYQDHKDSVDKYGQVTQNMKMNGEELKKVSDHVREEGYKRLQYVENWERKAMDSDSNIM